MSRPRPFGPRPTQEHGIAVLARVLLISCLAALSRLVDFSLLLRWPRLCVAAVRVWARGWTRSPYREDSFERNLRARGAGLSPDALTYGETPVFTAMRTLKRAGAAPGVRFLDLGAGRGRVLLAARALGCETRGVELLDAHVEVARPLLARVGIDLVRGNALDADAREFDIIYVTWTCLSAATRSSLVDHLTRTMQAGARLVCISWPLDDTHLMPDAEEGFVEVDSWRGVFTWGCAPIFIYRRVHKSSNPPSDETR